MKAIDGSPEGERLINVAILMYVDKANLVQAFSNPSVAHRNYLYFLFGNFLQICYQRHVLRTVFENVKTMGGVYLSAR